MIISSKPKILVVDDEPANIDYLVNILQEEYELKVANSGKMAIKIMAKFSMDLVLLDINMPDMDGYDVAKHMIVTEKLKNIPFIFLTAKNNENFIVKGFKLGAKDYITKPFNKEELKVRVANHIKSYLQTKQIIEQQNMLIQQSKVAAMGEMTTMLAHQWRQPLNAVSVLLQEIKIKKSMNALDDEDFDKIYAKVKLSLDYLSETINHFRDFFKQDQNLVEYDVTDIIEQAYSVLQIKMDLKFIKSKIEIQEEVEERCTRILGSPGEFKQAIISVINNAIEAFETTSIEPIIQTVVTCNEEMIKVEVKDNAGGIKEEILEKIFEPYSSTKLEQNGSGLGLYLSKMILEKHSNGTIKGYNQDNGAVFEIILNK